MIDSAARAAAWSWPVDGGRRGPKGDSGGATDPFGPWRSTAAGRGQAVVGVVESVIWLCPDQKVAGLEHLGRGAGWDDDGRIDLEQDRRPRDRRAHGQAGALVEARRVRFEAGL